MLSYLIYKAVEVIMEEFGPDHVIFPALLKQPLVDKWIYEELEDLENIHPKIEEWFEKWRNFNRYKDELTIANFPNRFLAILPYGKAKEVADKCKERIINEFEEWANKVVEILKTQNQIKETIEEHLKYYFKIYYVIVPWGSNTNDIETILEEYKNLYR